MRRLLPVLAAATALGSAALAADDLPAGHPKVRDGAAAPTADELIQQLDSAKDLKERQKTFEVAAALGRLYYSHARYQDAVEYLSQALQKTEPTRSLYLEQKKKLQGKRPQAGGCGGSSVAGFEAEAAIARDRVKRGDPAGAASCALAALQPALETEELRANARFLLGDSAGALSGYERVLQIAEDSPNSLFGRAAVLFDAHGNDVKSLRRAKDDLSTFLRLYPGSPRADQTKKLLARSEQAIVAGGQDRLAQKRAGERRTAMVAAPNTQPSAPAPREGKSDQLRPLTPEMIEAVQNTERTPALQQGLAKLVEEGEDHLARGRYQEALDAYKRVVPFQPENGRAKAGMAWSLVKLDRRPMADRVWSVAVSADPAAVDKLGDTLAAKGDKAGAKALWSKLAETAPSYADSSSMGAKLR
jgi:tetratricopeptide (TPR) repeat protein